VIAPREWVEEIRATLPELPWIRRARIQKEWGLKDEEMRDLVNAGALAAHALVGDEDDDEEDDELRCLFRDAAFSRAAFSLAAFSAAFFSAAMRAWMRFSTDAASDSRSA